ncbi:Rieske (2Fe-2S) protein [Novosphingobium ovatum]|uniref:Rieske (2Fe-2S) protein n=1 Tax=Novosphingobium ovatum TaxID=1908523 RepID=UPI0029FEE963|nr:Rieske (2Fe-2S) protein [Novosphingobium ovatum]
MTEASWHRLGAESDIAEGAMQVHVVGGWHVLVARTDGAVVAVNDRCTHAAAKLSTGRIRRGALMCPLHGARFELADGRCIGGAYPNLRAFELRVVDGMVEVLVPDAPPGMDETPVTV